METPSTLDYPSSAASLFAANAREVSHRKASDNHQRPEPDAIILEHPGCATLGHVSQSWLNTYYHCLLPGTIIRYSTGKIVVTTAEQS